MEPQPIEILLLEDNQGDADLILEMLEEYKPGAYHVTRSTRWPRPWSKFARIGSRSSFPICGCRTVTAWTRSSPCKNRQWACPSWC